MATHPHAHTQFKVFVGTTVEDINKQAQAFAADIGASPRSIGVEHIGSQYVVSLGYVRTGTASTVKLTSVSLGKLSPSAPEAIEAALNNAAKGIDNLICHELYDAPDGEFIAVFLS
jgi:hypothetical protein